MRVNDGTVLRCLTYRLYIVHHPPWGSVCAEVGYTWLLNYFSKEFSVENKFSWKKVHPTVWYWLQPIIPSINLYYSAIGFEILYWETERWIFHSDWINQHIFSTIKYIILLQKYILQKTACNNPLHSPLHKGFNN